MEDKRIRISGKNKIYLSNILKYYLNKTINPSETRYYAQTLLSKLENREFKPQINKQEIVNKIMDKIDLAISDAMRELNDKRF